MLDEEKTSDAVTLPSHISDPFSLALYPEDYWSRAEDRKCFQTDESKVKIECIDVDSEGQVLPHTITSFDQLCDYSSKSSTAPGGLRIIAIPQVNSWRPLKVTSRMARRIVEITSASSEVLELFLSFHQKIGELEKAYSSAPMFKSTDHTFEVGYIFKYAFPKTGPDGLASWVVRQTGVYQKYDRDTNHSTWIFLHPSTDCPFQRRLREDLGSADQCAKFRQHPFLIHNMLFSTYFPNWRAYLAHHQAQVLPMSPAGLADRVNDELEDNYRRLDFVRSIEYSCAPLQPIFQSLTKTFNTLARANDFLGDRDAPAMRQLLDNYHSHVDAYSQSALILQTQTARAAQILSDAISFKISMTAQAQTDYMLDLTVATSDDAKTVRVITVVTLIYLPSTFMATLLGMNSFFEMDPESHNVVVSPQFWIWVVCSVPLTLATVSYWWFFRWKRHQKAVKEQNLLIEGV
ncbi:hypothetical protein FE257_005907 [Aspergillus nanangensis]|uniref:CorA-like transporter domain-containing protein n=1 Tax=Aspergillus nanangensis TaxID=2582783 RepID=A0AAD4GV65_ASPNN|nr:hypothetical protein FE257_005907 [Aspergillus nanangensis]